MIYIAISKISSSRHNFILNKYLNKFPVKYQNKILSYIKWEDQQMSVIGRLLLSKLLNKKVEDLDIIIRGNKPEYVDSEWFFSISHSTDIVICALSKKIIGIDIEKKKTLTLNNFAPCMTEREWDTIYRFNPEDKFYEYWTKKEAIIKLFEQYKFNSLQSLEVIDDVVEVGIEKVYLQKIFLNESYQCHLASFKKENEIISSIYNF